MRKETNIAKLDEAIANTISGYPQETTVRGTKYIVYSDYCRKETIAYNTETEEFKVISSSGYVSNDLTIRKYIAMCWWLKSFRK